MVIAQERESAARHLQRAWKRYRSVSLVPKAWELSKFHNLAKIQKYLRGYIVFHRVKRMRQKEKFDSNIQYFEAIKNNLMVQAQRVIRFYWRLK